MIIILVILATLGFYFFTAVWQDMKGRTLWSLLSLAVLVVSIGSFVMYDNAHLGMKVQTKSATTPLVSPSKDLNVLTYKQLGTGSERIFIYRTDPAGKVLTTRADTNVTTKVKQVGATTPATITTTTQHYVCANGFSRLMFGILGGDGTVKHVTYTFRVNDQWLVANTNQAAKLKTVMKNPAVQARMKAQVGTVVQQKLAAAMQKNPHLNKVDQVELQKDALQAAKVQVIKGLIK